MKTCWCNRRKAKVRLAERLLTCMMLASCLNESYQAFYQRILLLSRLLLTCLLSVVELGELNTLCTAK